jgi:hypothetical protein
MTKAAPSVYLLHGENQVGIKRFISKLSTRLGDPSLAEMNTTRMEESRA